MITVIRNTYPKMSGVAHAEEGDEAEWVSGPGSFDLIRQSDNRSIFSISGLDRNGNRYSNGKPPVLVGIIGQLKNKGWIFEVSILDEGFSESDKTKFAKEVVNLVLDSAGVHETWRRAVNKECNTWIVNKLNKFLASKV